MCIMTRLARAYAYPGVYTFTYTLTLMPRIALFIGIRVVVAVTFQNVCNLFTYTAQNNYIPLIIL